MNRFYGFDLGDAESAVARLEGQEQKTPEILTIEEQKSIITAFALLRNGEMKIGENACYADGAVRRRIRFKSHFLDDPIAAPDIKSFAAGVLGELYGNGDLIKNEDCCFYVGCPAGWKPNDRERYRAIFQSCGYPPTKIVAESRAALVSACQSRHLQVGYDILTKPLLVVDIGSSTTDFAYVCGGREVDIQTAGEVRLGGGIMDEILLTVSLENTAESGRIAQIFEESEAWKNYCEFAARRLKEKYYAEEAYWESIPCTETVRIFYDRPVSLKLVMNREIADQLVNRKVDKLGMRSFREVFQESLIRVKEQITGAQPELVFLTGGVSKLPLIRTWCEAAFPDAVIINGAEPEFSVARGLAWCGRIDEEVRGFRTELADLIKSDIVETIVGRHMKELYRAVVDALVEPIIEEVAEPVFDRWRSGEIGTLQEADEEMQGKIESFLGSAQVKERLIPPITKWLRPVSEALEEYTIPICIRYHVPYSSMNLSSYLQSSDMDIRLDARNVFAVEELTWLIDSIVSVIIGLICGGSGIALVSSGMPGILIGFAVSFLVLALGKHQMEKIFLRMNVPKPMRKLVPKNTFRMRKDTISEKVQESLLSVLEDEKDEEISLRMTGEITRQIEACLTRMAEVVEIPL